jgi:hypothetical protein
MPTRHEMLQRRCVPALIHIFEQVPLRATAKGLSHVHAGVVEALLMQSLTQWEETLAHTALRKLGVEPWKLGAEAGELVIRRSGTVRDRAPSFYFDQLDSDSLFVLRRGLSRWLALAATIAKISGSPYVGPEHLLEALVSYADGRLTGIIVSHGLTKEKVEQAVDECRQERKSADPYQEYRFSPVSDQPWGAQWDATPATGLPRRFGLSVMLSITTLFAIVFSTLQLYDAQPEVYVILGVLLFGVGVGQMFLFKGAFPRAASVWTGAVLFPIEVVALGVYLSMIHHLRDGGGAIVGIAVISTPVGAFLGYLAGGLTAGVVLLLEMVPDRGGPRTDEDEATLPDAPSPRDPTTPSGGA